MPPQCRLRAKDEGTAYPRSACLKCNWSIASEDHVRMACIDLDYQAPKGVVLNTVTVDYRQRMQFWVDRVCENTGLSYNNQEHVPLILMYTILAMVKGEETTPEMVHDVWSLWTLYGRKITGHSKLVSYEELDDRTKHLDKIDLWSIHAVAKEMACGSP